jgi:hypothetical protein
MSVEVNSTFGISPKQMGLVGAVHARVIRLAGCFSLQTLTLPMACALLFWQVTALLHLSNYTRPFIVKVKPDEVLGNYR